MLTFVNLQRSAVYIKSNIMWLGFIKLGINYVRIGGGIYGMYFQMHFLLHNVYGIHNKDCQPYVGSNFFSYKVSVIKLYSIKGSSFIIFKCIFTCCAAKFSKHVISVQYRLLKYFQMSSKAI